MATPFLKENVGEAVQLAEPSIDIRHHRLKQDAVLDAAHADAVAGQAKRPRQMHCLAASLHEDFGNACFEFHFVPT
jgi:hypothetical protein